MEQREEYNSSEEELEVDEGLEEAPDDAFQAQQLTIWGEINPEISQYIIENLHYLSKLTDYPKKEVDILIRSEGGDAIDMIGICDAMDHLKKKGWIVKTKGFGCIMSAAILLIAHGSKGHRTAGRNTRFMLHSVSGGSGGTMHEIKMSLKEIENIQSFYIKDLVKQTKMKKAEIDKMFQQNINFYFSANDAKKFGIVDEIE